MNASKNTECASLNNEKYMSHATLINFYPNEYSQELRCQPLAVNLDRWVAPCNTLHGLSDRVYGLNKIEDFNLSIFNMITRISES